VEEIVVVLLICLKKFGIVFFSFLSKDFGTIMCIRIVKFHVLQTHELIMFGKQPYKPIRIMHFSIKSIALIV